MMHVRPAAGARLGLVRLLALVLAVTACGAASSSARADVLMPVDRAAGFLTDAQGRVLMLHGINMVDKRPPYAPDAVGFGDDDAAFLATEGFSTVRLGIIYKALEPKPGVYDDGYLDRIAGTVDTLARHGIVSLLDFHQDLYNERFQGEGWPDWAVLDDGLPAEPQAGFPDNYVGMPALQRAFDHFFNNDPADPATPEIGLGDRYAAAWAHVAQRFRDVDGVLGYDLMNEPWPGTEWQDCVNPGGCPVADQRLAEFTQRTLKAIREVDETTLVFYEPYVLFNFGSGTTLPGFGDQHTAMSFHDYCLSAGSSDSYAGCDTADDLVFQHATERTRSTGDPTLMTEFGATGAEDVLTAMVQRADRNMIGWQEWHYCGCEDPTTSGPGDKQAIVLDPAREPAGDNLKTATLDLLSRPHPRAIAGTPSSFGYDAATKTFTLAYVTSRAGGGDGFGPDSVTEIPTPLRAYPHGYAVAVTGGTIRSVPGAPVALVASCTGFDHVRVTITPTGSAATSCPPPPTVVAALRLRLRLSPAVVSAGRRVSVRATVRVGRRPFRGAVVRLAGARAVTDASGRATLRKRFERVGPRSAVARATGYLPGRARLRVRPRR
jgi:endoglycosylceramidase